MPKVLLLENPHPDADAIYRQAGFEVERRVGALDEDELIEARQGVDAVGIRSKTAITEKVLASCPRLSCIGAYCIGTNQIDLSEATRRGVAVFNAPYSNTRSVVEMAISLIIALSRQLPQKNAALHRGVWQKSAAGAHEVRGKTLGIIGYGHIGMQLSVLAEAMGMKVIFYDTAERLALGNAHGCKTMEELLGRADVVSIHVDGNPTNANMFGPQQFEQMQPGAILLNLSRGSVIDSGALVQALEAGMLSGAAIDVFPTEPKKNGDPFNSPLAKFANVVLTPHVGGSTEEAQLDIGQFVTSKVVGYFQSASTDMSVNLPNLTLPVSKDALYRVAYIHTNAPGVLAEINHIFASHGANINGQILGTQGRVGYVITDISSELPVETVAALKRGEETIKLRVLTH